MGGRSKRKSSKPLLRESRRFCSAALWECLRISKPPERSDVRDVLMPSSWARPSRMFWRLDLRESEVAASADTPISSLSSVRELLEREGFGAFYLPPGRRGFKAGLAVGRSAGLRPTVPDLLTPGVCEDVVAGFGFNTTGAFPFVATPLFGCLA